VKKFPILEFDSDRNAFLKPTDWVKRANETVDRCVLCFFAEAIEKVLSEYEHKIIGYFKAESLILPVYAVNYEGKKIALVQAGVGAPIAAAQIEEVTALTGCDKYIACGSCGSLINEIAVGHLFIPTTAVRDEGTSYHYAPPSREIEADADAVQVIADVLAEHKVPYMAAKTWTTDGIYRETPAKIKRRKEEGCMTVEMETAAYIAATRYNGAKFGQILYAGDNLGGEEWDSRDYTNRTDIREMVLRLAIEACGKL